MGKHASGEKNYEVAKGPLFAVLAVIVITALVIAWFNLRGNNEDAQNSANSNCSRGDLTLNVTTDPAAVGDVQQLVQAYGESKPVVKDFCVRPQIRVAGSQEVLDAINTGANNGGAADNNAAGDQQKGQSGVIIPGAWVPADISFVDKAKQAKNISIGNPTAWLKPIAAGVAVAQKDADALKDATWSDIAARSVATPGGSDAALSAIVNASLGGGEESAKQRAALGGTLTSDSLLPKLTQSSETFDSVAATKPMLAMAGDGLSFIEPKDAPQLHAPVVNFGSGGQIDENTARAAADFAKFAKENGADGAAAQSSLTGDAAALLPVMAAIKTDPFAGAFDAEAAEGSTPPSAGSSSPNAAPAAANKPGSALVLVDASAESDIPVIRDSLIPLLDKATAPEGARVALWNYSSPQSEGVTSPVRANVLFAPVSDGVEDTKATLNQISAVGQPWMWRSLTNAFSYAVDNYAANMPNRIVLVTTGKDSSGDNARAAVDQLKKLIDNQRKVAIDVVMLPGSDPASAELKSIAATTGGSLAEAPSDAAGLDKNLAAALGVQQ